MSDEIIHAPLHLHTPDKILDVGCGTGAATRTIASKYPSSNVYGLDLTPVPHIPGRDVSARVHFVQGDILNLGQGETEIREGGFGLIFSRLLVCGMSDWPRYIRETSKLLKEGTGWLEIHDIDLAWYNSSNEIISGKWGWLGVFKQAAAERGLDFTCGSQAGQWMEAVGLVDVQRFEYRWPFGGQWEDEPHMQAFGEYVVAEIPKLFPSAMEKVLVGKGCPSKQIEVWCEQMKNDCRPEKGKHFKFFVTIGRRLDLSTAVV